MIKLVPGKRNDFPFYGVDNTTRAMRFTRVKRSSKVMQILKCMILHPRQFEKRDILKHVYGSKFKDYSQWLHGFFSALHHFSFATFVRRGHKCFWQATPEGINFYKALEA